MNALMRLERRALRHMGAVFLGRLRDFAERLASTEADLFVLIARKAVCLIDVFRDLGWPIPTGRFVSDRVVESMTREELAGKRVIVVDDIVICGSTIHRLCSYLRSNGATVDTLVAAVDTRWLAEGLFLPSGGEMLLNDEDAARFYSGLVKTIMAFGRPYAVDFPILRFDVRPACVHEEAWALPGCQVTDVTSRFQLDNEQRRLVVHIAPSVLSAICGALGFPYLAPLVAISKIRLYANLCTDRLLVMPIVTFNRLALDEIEGGLKALLASSMPPEEMPSVMQSLARTPVLGHRVIIYALSYAVARAALAALANGQDPPVVVSPSGLSDHLGGHDIGVALGPAADVVRDSVLGKLESMVFWPSGVDTEGASVPSVPQALSPLGQPIVDFLGSSLFLPSDGLLLTEVGNYFLALHRGLEIPARKRIKAGRREGILWDRLRMGLTFGDISYLLSKEGWDLELPALRRQLSSHVDYLVDRGVAVPGVGMAEDGCTYRFYRPGEDVHFLDKHYKMLCCALSHAFQMREVWSRQNVRDAWRIHIEKLLVVLIKCMFEQGICSVVTDSVEGGRVRVHYDRMGVVAEHETMPEGRAEDLYHYLVDQHYLGDGAIEEAALASDFEDAPPFSEQQQSMLDTLAMLWTREIVGLDEGAQRTAIVMASCTNDTDAAWSMYTDVEKCLGDLKDLSPLGELGGLKWQEQLRTIRQWGENFRGLTKLAADNFCLKLRAWDTGSVREFIEAVRQRLVSDDELVSARNWEAMWRTVAPAHVVSHRLAPDVIQEISGIGLPLAWLVTVMEATARYATGAELDEAATSLLAAEVVADTEDRMEALGSPQIFRSLMDELPELLKRERGKPRVNQFAEVARQGHRLLECLQTAWSDRKGTTYRCLKKMWHETYAESLRPFGAACFVWYDIKDSRARRSKDPASYRKAVKAFENQVNGWLKEQLARYEGRFCVYAGGEEDKDDEKHIFVDDSGLVKHFVAEILKLAEVSGVFVRLMASGCREIDQDLKVQHVGQGCAGRAEGDFFDWLADIKACVKKESTTEEPPCAHTLFYLDTPWPMSGSPPVLPRHAATAIRARAEVGGVPPRVFNFRCYEIVDAFSLGFIELGTGRRA